MFDLPAPASVNRQNNISLVIENDAKDNMLAYIAMGNQELAKQIADRIRQVRLAHFDFQARAGN